MPIREWLVNMTTASGGGKVAVMYADQSGDPNDQVTALRTFFSVWASWAPNTFNAQPSSTQRVIDESTGMLLGQTAQSGGAIIGGSGSGTSAADATQVLVRWNTGVVVGGRFLKGRTFLPNVPTGQIVSGNLHSNVIDSMTNAAQALIAADVGFGVWHRPRPGVGDGAFYEFQSATVWPELAVLRRRRG